jgi:murein DD-endopeptidase MepM/ murein hydrolase activator NlpD
MSGGRVRFSGTMEDFGLVVWLDHDDEVVTVYAHLSELRVQTGDQLAKSDIVGLSGSTGNATGPHLHFEIWRRGVQLDPVAMLGGPPGP